MRILGIDPGTSLIGYGLVETLPAGKLRCLDYGVCHTAANQTSAERTVLVYNFFKKLIKKHQPDQAALEKLFFFKNAKTVISVSEMRGVILFSLQKQGVPIAEFTPLQVKQAVSSYGRAEKSQVQRMICLMLGLKETPKPDDAADALAIAICAANTVHFT